MKKFIIGFAALCLLAGSAFFLLRMGEKPQETVSIEEFCSARASKDCILEEAERVAKEIPSATKRAVALIEISSFLFSIGDKENAYRLLLEAEQIASTTDDNWRLLQQVATAWLNSERPEDAFRATNHVKGNGERVEATLNVAKAMFEAGEDEVAFRLIDQAANSRLELASHSIYLDQMSVTLAEAQYFEAAENIAKQQRFSGARDNTLRQIVLEYLTKKRFQEAALLAEEITANTSRAESLITVAMSMFRNGEVQNASEIVTKVKDILGGIVDADDRTTVQVELTEKFLEVNRVEEAMLVLEDAELSLQGLRDGSRKETLLGQIARTYAKGDRAVDVYRIIEQIDRQVVQNWVLAFVAVEFSKNGEAEGADRAFSEAVRVAKEVVEEDARNRSLSTIAIWLAKTDRIDDASRVILKDISSIEIRDTTLSTLTDWFLESEKLDQAERLASLIEDQEKRSEEMQNIAFAHANSGGFEQAERILDQHWTDWARLQIIKAYVEDRRLEKVTALTAKISYKPYFELAEFSFAKGLSVDQQFDAAFAIANRLENERLRAQVLLSIAENLGK